MAADVLQVLYIMYIYMEWARGSLRLPRKQYVVHQLFLHSFVYINHHERHQWVSEREGCAHTLQVLIKLTGCNNCFLHGHVMQWRSLFVTWCNYVYSEYNLNLLWWCNQRRPFLLNLYHIIILYGRHCEIFDVGFVLGIQECRPFRSTFRSELDPDLN